MQATKSNIIFNSLFLIIAISICFISLYSSSLGLGGQYDFFLYKIIGLSRTRTVVIALLLTIVAIVNFCNIPKYRISILNSFQIILNKLNYKELYKSSVLVYLFLSSFISVIHFYIFGNHTAFEWTITQDIPLILRFIDPNFIPNDFYTNSVVGSPRFVFSYIVYLFSTLGINWYSVLYTFKFLGIVFASPLLFLMMYKVFISYQQKLLSVREAEIIKIILLFCSLSFTVTFQNLDTYDTPFGWPAIQNSTILTLYRVSFIFGLIYNILSFSNGRAKYFSSVLLLLSAAIHPVIGLCHFIINCIFWLPILISRPAISRPVTARIIIDFMIGLLLPFILLQYFFSSDEILDSATFINIYIYLRHPAHYLLSVVIHWRSYLWAFAFAIPLYLSIKEKDKKLIVLSTLVFSSLILAPLLQYLGTEVFQIKSIAIIGPSRFTTFATILLLLNLIIVIAKIHQNSKTTNGNVYRNYNKFINYFFIEYILIFITNFFNKLFNYWKLILILFILLLLSIFLLTNKHPLDYLDNGSNKQLIEWINKNTPENSVYAVELINGSHNLNFLVRVYARRAIFTVGAFPFNENFMLEYIRRYQLYKFIDQMQPSDFACLQQHYQLDYLIIKPNSKYDDYKPIFSSNDLFVYDIHSFKKAELCDIELLFENAKNYFPKVQFKKS